MKKVLVLSALGCIATVGAVFAAFTIDPTNEVEVAGEDIEVDFTQHVFSKFDSITEFDYLDSKSGQTICEDIPVNKPSFKFTTKPVYDSYGITTGTTLDLQCKDYTLENLQTYLQWRKENPKEEAEDPADWETTNNKLAPRGYAFKYEYDEKFLERIEIDDTKPPEWEDWQWAIYKTSFSTGLSSSNFKREDLDDYGIVYIDPIKDKPNYKDLSWNKKSSTMTDWLLGGPGFIIQPDVNVIGEEEKRVEVLNSGTILFTGAEMTENLFAGTFTDEKASKDCEEYLKGMTTDEQPKPRKNFSLKIKASEYFPVKSYDLAPMEGVGSMFVYHNESGDELVTNDRVCFNFPIDANTEELFKNGYILNRFSVFGQSTSEVTRLIASETEPDALGLKVMLDSPLNGKSDITQYFKYCTDKNDPRYNSIYFINSLPENATGWIPTAGDVISYEFYFRKNNGDPSLRESIAWAGAAIELVKEPTSKVTLTKSTDTYEWDGSANPLTLNKNEINRFIIPIDTTEYLDEFSMTKDGSDPLKLTDDITKVYYLDEAQHLLPLSSKSGYYQVAEGKVILNAKAIYNNYGAKTGESLIVDIENIDTTPLTAQSAKCTTKPGPVTKEFELGDYTFNEESDPTLGGKWTLDLAAPETIEPNTTLKFTAAISDNLLESLGAYIDDKMPGAVANFTFTLKGEDGKDFDVSGDEGATKPKYQFIRDTGDSQIDIRYDEQFVYMGTNAPGTFLANDDSKNYSKQIMDDYKKKYTTMIISIEYGGKESARLNKAELQFNVK